MSTKPPIRACLFDMDGLLLNTEDLYTLCSSTVLLRHGRPPLPWSLKAKMMGVPGSSNGDLFHAWAQLPISREQFAAEQREQQEQHFPECRPLPGVEKLLATLRTAKSGTDGRYPMQMALATSSETYNFNLKTSNPTTRAVLDLIELRHRVLGDDPRVPKGRGKPSPDIYLVALQAINDTLPSDVPQITPAECLVFEDSVIGVEAGRRAGMQVVWVPHAEIAAQYHGQESEVLAGRIGLVPIGDEEQLGQPGDGWAQQLPSLENFPYARYGMFVS
ncbi:HAD-like domain-containing protein [Microdochium trichocladiopsis]|uniref:HAD-like domain-containing protein n=1 Tax=Microdochium trichocladiopsis TaxID=1682393 RepID=A0A9P8Y6B4_9PEZI|nr:HAD-like domain-containing protein [Microdochium trichocladiopsis]KAH7032910.1 HAD-like domain-containing protein [Microdochium trichocladiopsis]